MPDSGRTISDSYYVFPDPPILEDRLNPQPTQVVILATLELAVNDGRGNYLLMLNPRYDPVEGDADAHGLRREAGQWIPPYVSRTVPSYGSRPWRSVKTIMDAVEEEKARWNPQERLSAVIAGWGCGLSELDPAGQFTEYKRSWGSPGTMKVYHVLRYRARTHDCDETALADPEARKGLFHLPIDDERYEAATHRRTCPIHEREEVMFLGQPLATNLEHVVRDPATRRRIGRDAVRLNSGHFYGEEEGLLVAADIAGYGAACKYIDERMMSIESDADDRAATLRDSATAAFTELFHEAGIRQVHTAGDGFIAAVPMHGDAELPDVLGRFLGSYKRLIGTLEMLNARIRAHYERNNTRATDPAPTMGSRLALHWGRYKYGKMALAASLIPAFDGGEIIRVARLEQGLSALIKGPTDQRAPELAGRPHAVIASQPFADRAPGLAELDPQLELLGPAPARSKESEEQAYLLAWRLD
jgi:hypothetical protein